jgi:hypothetical protein
VIPEPPPQPHPRRRNGFLKLYDLPIYLDWIAWLTAFWVVISPIAIADEPNSKSNLPIWADALLATAIFVGMFGILPAYIRLAYRRLRWRQKMARGGMPLPASEPQHPFVSAPPVSPVEPSTRADAPPARMSSAPTGPSTAPAVRGPEPSAVVLGRDLEHSEPLRAARNSLQFPIARAAREVQLASDHREQYDAILRAAEALTVTLAISITAAFRATGDSLTPFSSLRSAYLERGVSLGHWLAVIKAAAKPVAGRAEPLPGMLEALRLGKGGTGLVPALDALVEERNRWAHGAGPRNNVEAGTRLGHLGSAIEDALARVAFLRQHPWVLVSSSSYRRGPQQFAITAADIMADHPDFERSYFSSSVPLADGVVYMMTANGAVDLTPFVVMRDCPECQQSELCYADRVYENRGLSLKSFARGHVMYDIDLVPELHNLFVSA